LTTNPYLEPGWFDLPREEFEARQAAYMATIGAQLAAQKCYADMRAAELAKWQEEDKKKPIKRAAWCVLAITAALLMG